MKRAIILHGMPSSEEYHNAARDSQSNSHWLPWLQQQLCVRDVLAQTPELPMPYAPSYTAWCDEFERYVIDEETLLIGHSCGGGFLLRWLSEHPERKVDRLVLVAPWLDVEHEYGDLFDFALARDLRQRTVHGIDYVYSRNDKPPMQSTLRKVQHAVDGLTYHDFPEYRHFTYKHMQTREFPELLKICLTV